MAAIQTRVTKLEAHYGVASFEDLVRRLTDEELNALLALYIRSNAGQRDESTLAEIEHIEGRYRWCAPG